MYPNPKMPNSRGLPVRFSTRNLAQIFLTYIPSSHPTHSIWNKLCPKRQIYFFGRYVGFGFVSQTQEIYLRNKLRVSRTSILKPWASGESKIYILSVFMPSLALKNAREALGCLASLGLGTSKPKPKKLDAKMRSFWVYLTKVLALKRVNWYYYQ